METLLEATVCLKIGQHFQYHYPFNHNRKIPLQNQELMFTQLEFVHLDSQVNSYET